MRRPLWQEFAQAVQEALISRLFSFVGAEPQLDDIALMILIRE
jgi:hypothetical protein